MTSPFIWIVIPALSGGILFFLRRWYRISVFGGTGVAILLSGLALVLPIGSQIRLGPLVFRVYENLDILGRQFILHDHDRVLLVVSYAIIAFWFGGTFLARAGRVMVPFGLVFAAILIAAFSVQPFLYGVILIEIAVIASIPILIRTSENFSEGANIDEDLPDILVVSSDQGFLRGVLRFLIFQTMGMPFLLLTGWFLAGVETTPADETVVLVASLIGFGFMFLLAIFPFHSWILLLIEKAQPYVATFIFVIFGWFVTLFALRFMDQYLWLRQSGLLFALRIAGLLVILIAASSVIFERHLGRMLGYAILLEQGYVLLAVSQESSLVMIFQMLLPRSLSLGVWALALGIIKGVTQEPDLKSIRGLYKSVPFTSISIILAQLSVAGLPLLASFPIRFALWQQLASESLWMGWLSLAGFAGLTTASLRTLSVIIQPESRVAESRIENWRIYLILGIATSLMLLVGLFPQMYLPLFSKVLQAFPNLYSLP